MNENQKKISKQQVEKFDGKDQIVFSESYNIYENELILKNIYGLYLTFRFEDTEPKDGQKDIEVTGEGKNGILTFSKKFRNTLGSGTSNKISLATLEGSGKELLFSVYGQTMGGKGSSSLNVVVNFYLRDI